MSALEDVESVSYRLDGELDNATLVWLPKEISIGADVLRPSLGVFGDGGGDLKFQVGVQHVRHWLNDRGGQWRNNLQFGYESLVSTSLYQPFDHAQRMFIEPKLFVSRSAEDLTRTENASRPTDSLTTAARSTSAGTCRRTRNCVSATWRRSGAPR